jgi:ABC-type lipoprotein export system ATPase subunit
MPLLELRNVQRNYDKGRVSAVNGISLQLEAAELVAIVGPSGSGKSTLINVISGLDPPDSGTVIFDGRAITSARDYTALRARKIGIVFQSFCLIPSLTAAENIELAMIGQTPGASNRRRRAVELLERVGLGERTEHLPSELSGGERQRVAIARAMTNSPELLLADEITGNLDQANGRKVIEILLEMSRTTDAALLFVTHDHEIAALCPRRIELVDGRIVRDNGLPYPFQHSPSDTFSDRPARGAGR